jgi:signal transduction histidine kinase/CheY-like chemotaxis protein
MDPAMMTSPADSLKNDELLKELHDSVEQELVKTVCLWSHSIIVFGTGGVAFVLYLTGQDNWINPLLVCIVGLCAAFFPHKIQMTASLSALILAIFKHALSQGCSASLVPALFGFLPCVFGFLFRTTRAVVLSTMGVLAALFVIFAVDLSGNCSSQPIGQTQKGAIVADRLVPLLMLILGNSIVINAIVKQSQKAVLLHAKAASSAAKLANLRRDVLHRVTHELRTPLNGIVGSVELLTTSDTMDEIDMENALTIKSCLGNIVRICDDVLLAAKSKKDDVIRNATVFMLASCVDDVAEIFAATAAQKGIKLKVEFVGVTTAMVRGMEIELRQVLLNLVGNAMKFTDSGSVTIRLREEPSPTPDILQCSFEVEDTGIGVETDTASMLFEAFHQGEQGVASRQHKGTGLGLTICREFVELMGGAIAVDGTRGRGSRFYFSLALKRERWASSNNLITNIHPAPRIVIADSEKESASSCLSVVKSIAQSAVTSTVESPSALLKLVDEELLDRIADEEALGATQHIAFMECDSLDTETLVSTLSKLRKAHWIVFIYCDHGDFSHMVSNSKGAYAVFRRPLPLVRVGDTFRDALAGVLAPYVRGRSMPINDISDRSVRSKEDMATGSRTTEETTRDGATTENTLEGGKTKENATKQTSGSASSVRLRTKTETSKTAAIELGPGSKVVVVDDTPVNVKVLVKMISRSTSAPIVSCFDGKSAIELVASSNHEGFLLIIMDWHMPGVCGLAATDSIRRLAKERGGPKLYICILTADVEGIYCEMETRNMSCERTISKGKVVKNEEYDQSYALSESDDEIATAMKRLLEKKHSNGSTVIDVVAEKPITFKCVQAILTWFQQQVERP